MRNKKLKIKIKLSKIPNGMHFEIQKTSRANVYKPKKGKGSYNRKDKLKEF